MKFEMRRMVLYAIICLLPFAALAQNDKKYEREAEDLRKEVWAWDRPEFAVQTIPGEYAGMSSVVIARHIEISGGRRKAARMGSFLMKIERELVMLNDKSAIERYSEISYTQMDRGHAVFYAGVRVIKPDGSIREIDAGDITLIRDENKSKEAKIAVPDLQVGDRLDYFFARQIHTFFSSPSYTFAMFDNSPIMHYSIVCDVAPMYAVEYRCHNDAPDFERTKAKDGGNVLETSKKNIPAYPANSLWVSPYKQLPIIEMNIMYMTTGQRIRGFSKNIDRLNAGMVVKNPSTLGFVEDEMIGMSGIKRSYSLSGGKLIGTASDYAAEVKGNVLSMHPDSAAAAFYYALRFETFLDIGAHTDPGYIRNFSVPVFFNSSGYLLRLATMMQFSAMKNNMVLLTSRYRPDINSIMNRDDLSYLLALPDAGGIIMGISDAFSPAFYIPYRYENIPNAVTVDTKMNTTFAYRKFDRGTIKVPGTTHEQNSRIEKLVISPSPENGALLVKRNSTLKGHYKSEVQKELILFEDYYEHERKLLGIKKSLMEDLEDSRRTKKFADELKAAFAGARNDQKEAFVKEAKTWFAADVDELRDHQVINLGVRHNSPDFIYSSEFTLSGFMKKAGNNFIIDVGRLQGTPLKIEASQRKRSLDVYAPFARSIHHEISIDIPAGYTAEGVANLNRKVENETGAFMAEASTDGKTVTIKVSRIFKNATEPSANWDKMLAFMDASIEWNNARLLLKKQ